MVGRDGPSAATNGRIAPAHVRLLRRSRAAHELRLQATGLSAAGAAARLRALPAAAGLHSPAPSLESTLTASSPAPASNDPSNPASGPVRLLPSKASPDSTGPKPGLREQVGQTRRAFGRLVGAHVSLLKAELGEIVGRAKVIAALAGAILAVALYVANLLAIGGTLFLGEWLFGSIGWGVLHGTLLGVALIVALGLVLIGAPKGLVASRWLAGAAVAIVVSLLLAFNLPHRGAELLAGSFPNLDPGWGPAVVGAVVGAILLGLLGAVAGARSGGAGPATGGLVGGAVVGALLGAVLGGVEWEPRVAVAIGITIGLLTWIVLMALGARGVDAGARFRELWPKQTYETALETRAWLEQEWANRRERLAKRS